MRMNDARLFHLPMSRHRLSPALAVGGAIVLAASSILATSASAGVTEAEATTCWTDQPGVIGTVDHPTDPSTVVLRMFTGGGFVPLEVAFLENPVFTLYGNNVAIFRPDQEMTDIFEPMAPYLCSQLTPEQVDELLELALDEGGLGDANEYYPDPFIVDTPNTLFTIDADGVATEVLVEALGFNPEAPDEEARAGFEALADVLTDFGPWVDTSEPFDVAAYRGLLTDVWAEIPVTPIAWPWDELSHRDFTGEGFATAPLTPDQVAEVAAVPNGGQGYIVLELPDGTLRSLAIKPLLPAKEDAASIPA